MLSNRVSFEALRFIVWRSVQRWLAGQVDAAAIVDTAVDRARVKSLKGIEATTWSRAVRWLVGCMKPAKLVGGMLGWRGSWRLSSCEAILTRVLVVRNCCNCWWTVGSDAQFINTWLLRLRMQLLVHWSVLLWHLMRLQQLPLKKVLSKVCVYAVTCCFVRSFWANILVTFGMWRFSTYVASVDSRSASVVLRLFFHVHPGYEFRNGLVLQLCKQAVFGVMDACVCFVTPITATNAIRLDQRSSAVLHAFIFPLGGAPCKISVYENLMCTFMGEKTYLINLLTQSSNLQSVGQCSDCRCRESTFAQRTTNKGKALIFFIGRDSHDVWIFGQLTEDLQDPLLS